MKIEHKIYLSNAVHILLIVLIGTFALHNLNEILTKFRFTVIAEGLNATFLEMRLAEKNYFLYGDDEALANISGRITQTTETLQQVRPEITRAVGAEKYAKLRDHLRAYARQVETIGKTGHGNRTAQKNLREAGQSLKTFSEDITALESERIGTIIVRSKNILLYSFWAVVLFALLFSNLIVRNIGNSLRKIVDLTRAISRGNYRKIEATPSNDEMGAVLAAINAMAEELRKREKEIVQSKRLASIGVLVAGVAHELNNPLNNISMIAQTYSEVYDGLSREERIGFMGRIDEETERLRVIIHNLLDYAKPKEQHLAPAAANQVIQKILALIQNMLDISNIKIRLTLARDLPEIYIDEHQIQQVLVNMATNAIQAMDKGGELSISSRFLPEEEMIEIEIRDNGKGIPPEFLDHIFDPFFTTKEESGTGLGLWVSYGIIKNHQGNIRVTSRLGAGTTFIITLPTCKKLGIA
ncbi:ATP-binding protein [Thiovibrio sp. JS02]